MVDIDLPVLVRLVLRICGYRWEENKDRREGVQVSKVLLHSATGRLEEGEGVAVGVVQD